jgi:ribonuclease E
MAKRMLIDTSHPEETRVAVISGNRLDDFDYESSSRKQLKGNIYLAKVTRVEPSLQAAFVEYGGNRHGFLPFSEIHPDYYRIPIADREALIAAEAEAARETAEAHDEAHDEAEDALEAAGDSEGTGEPADDSVAESAGEEGSGGASVMAADEGLESESLHQDAEAETAEAPEAGAEAASETETETDSQEAGPVSGAVEELPVETSVDTLGGDDVEDAARRRAKLMRRYKIQEVIKRRQVLLVQVTKEERGNKGAALTTYLSLAGRYCVLMPNTAKGGGISRKIASAKDRRRLKGILEDLDIPDGIAVIVRTAGSERTKAEIRRDYEFLVRLWDEIRSTTLRSTAPALIYEEASLIKRAIRDVYQSDTDEILVEGEEGYKSAKAFMKSLTPSHARKVKLYKEPTAPLFYRYQIENQIDAMHNPVVQLRSGGYIVLHMTEALVAIDVNSGKATRERHIEETAYKTNLEAADEVARQLRLRDMAGLIVIDFIDMEEQRHNRAVERRLKEAMRIDRARIQLGRISPFGLLELSRQRLRPSLLESSTEPCRYCTASGYVRTTQSVALHILRGLEEEGIRRGGGEVSVTAPRDSVLHLVNQMRERLVDLEQRYGLKVWVKTDDDLIPPNYSLVRGSSIPRPAAAAEAAAPVEAEERHFEADTDDEELAAERTERTERAERGDRGERGERGERGDRKRGRSRRRRRRPGTAAEGAEAQSGNQTRHAAEEPSDDGAEQEAAGEEASEAATARPNGSGGTAGSEDRARRRRRGKRGGRRRSRRAGEEGAAGMESESGTAPSESAGEDTAQDETGDSAAQHPSDDSARENGTTDHDVAFESDRGSENGTSAAQTRGPVRGETAAPSADEDTDSQPTVPDSAAAEGPEEAESKRRGWWNRWT